MYENVSCVMKSNPKDLLVKSTIDGIEKIKNEYFALLCESKLIEYMVERDCELVQIGGLLDDKTYGIGTPTDKTFIYYSKNSFIIMK